MSIIILHVINIYSASTSNIMVYSEQSYPTISFHYLSYLLHVPRRLSVDSLNSIHISTAKSTAEVHLNPSSR